MTDFAELREAVASLRWIYARTYATPERMYPHWYIHRYRTEGVTDELYLALFRAVKRHGVREPFRHYRQQYLYLGDGFKYWVMTWNERESLITNRTHIDWETRLARGDIPSSRPSAGLRNGSTLWAHVC